METSLKDLARVCIQKGDCFGLDLMGQDGGKLISDLRASLTTLLEARGIKDVDMTLDSSLNKALETFLTKVLPFYLQEGVANARDFAGNDPAAMEEMLAANFDFETLVDLAAEFVEGAAKAALQPNQPLNQAEKSAVMLTLAEMEETKTRVEILDSTGQAIMKRAAIKGKMAEEMAKEVTRMTYLSARRQPLTTMQRVS